CQQGYTYLYNF
nr:immunoglobulin light chain junction region [Macaca mulatta]MOV82541.1 immunoglobulin light chain junction region [Macaca mulatta]